MTTTLTLAVAAPVTHTSISPTPQTSATPLTAGNYLGGTAIFVVLAVMVATGLSAAGLVKSRKATKLASHDTPHIVH